MDKNYLKPDMLTNGVITRILEESWKGNSIIKMEDLRSIHQVLLENQVFGEVAENIYVPGVKEEVENSENELIKGLKAQIERNRVPENKKNHVYLFQNKGFILKDGIHASAFGRFNYIYRSKGIRIFWFETGLIEYRAVYSTIDEEGFHYSAEEIDGCNIFMKNEDLMNSPLNEAFGSGEILISNLIEIKANFVRDFALEYVLFPPDVECFSTFSIQLREEVWDSIIEMIKELALDHNEEKLNLLKYLTEFNERQSIHPKAYHIITLFDFYRENQYRINSDKFHELMSFLRKSSEPEGSIQSNIEFSSFIAEIDALPTGIKMANDYHDLIFNCLVQIFENSLTRGKKEVNMNQGRKRIDIVFDNFDNKGFFAHIRDRHNIFCPKIFIECKNYSTDPTNQEVDQLIGRLGNISGKFGILICRQVENEELLMQRCKAARDKGQGHIIYLVDKDIKNLLLMKEALDNEGIINYLLNKWDRLILDN